MSIRCDTIGNVTVVQVLSPVLDAPGAAPLLQEFAREALRKRYVVIDASLLTAIDADGMRALCACYRVALKRGVQLGVAGVPSRARTAMRLMGFDAIVPVYNDVHEALFACGIQLPAAPARQLLAS